MGAEAASGSQRAGPDSSASPWWMRFVRVKGHIPPEALWLLIIAACVPLILALARVLALPGGEAPAAFGLDYLRELGRMLNQSASLRWVPPDDRPQILYLLLLPTGALLVALARLTFGLQVLGLRAILLAIGFQEIGFLPSLALMAVVLGVIIAVRPSMRRIRLPLYARITVILCIAAAIMVAALLIAPWVHSEAVWSVAFFPVIIMAMMAEGIAKTLAKDNVIKAIWRLGWTIVLALVIAVLGQITAVGTFALHFPELMLTQLLAIVFIAEFLDLRLLEHWPARLSRLVDGVRPWYPEKPRVAFVRNRWSTGVIGRLGRKAPSKYRKRSVQAAVDALRDQGFAVKVFEGDMGLMRELQDFLAPDPQSDAPGGIVLNLATGTQGNGRFCQVPAMLEMAGIAYTGPDPVAHARLTDRYVLMTVLREAGLPVRRFSLMTDVRDVPSLGFPIAVSPRCEPDVARVIVNDRQALKDAVCDVLETYDEDAFIEEWPESREFQVALIGNEPVECLPLLEYSADDGRKLCPALLSEGRAWRVRECAFKAYRAAGCRDHARIDLRLSEFGEPAVVGVNWVDLFSRRGSFATAAEAAGYSYGDLIRRIIDVASMRYAAARAPYAERAPAGKSVVALAQRGMAAK